MPVGFEARIAPLNGLGNGKSRPASATGNRSRRWRDGNAQPRCSAGTEAYLSSDPLRLCSRWPQHQHRARPHRSRPRRSVGLEERPGRPKTARSCLPFVWLRLCDSSAIPPLKPIREPRDWDITVPSSSLWKSEMRVIVRRPRRKGREAFRPSKRYHSEAPAALFYRVLAEAQAPARKTCREARSEWRPDSGPHQGCHSPPGAAVPMMPNLAALHSDPVPIEMGLAPLRTFMPEPYRRMQNIGTVNCYVSRVQVNDDGRVRRY